MVDFGFMQQNAERRFVGVLGVWRLQGAGAAPCVPFVRGLGRVPFEQCFLRSDHLQQTAPHLLRQVAC